MLEDCDLSALNLNWAEGVWHGRAEPQSRLLGHVDKSWPNAFNALEDRHHQIVRNYASPIQLLQLVSDSFRL